MKVIKRIKNNSSHSRFQVKWRRRREGKTNYYKRKNLLIQDKQKYNASKYRMVVRLSKKNLLCQLIYSRLEGDFILSSSYSKKLNLIGVSLISNNFPTAYITGLHLSSKFLKEKFSFINKKDSLENKLKVILDVGLTRITTGNRVFATMKGAVDGGLMIPHNEKRFPGYKKNEAFDIETMRDRIEGKHIMEYMELLKEEDEEKYSKQFKRFIEKEISPSDYWKMNCSVIKNIIDKSNAK
jgi:large subunit ribosomal protein L5e